MPSFDQTWHDIHFTSRDGLRLYARHYPAAGGARGRPVVCLAGLTRNSKDFHDLAEALAGHAACPRDVYCLDYRGRGRSQYDPDWKNYTVLVEMQDVLDFMTLRGLHDAAVIGTSRGGLIAMVMAGGRPAAGGARVGAHSTANPPYNSRSNQSRYRGRTTPPCPESPPQPCSAITVGNGPFPSGL